MNVTHVLAPNPGLFTGPGTNTWIVESGGAVVIVDPGPRLEEHAVAIRRAIGESRVELILVTHTHPDHAPLAEPLAAELQVPTAGRAPGPEFTPDRLVADGEMVHVGGVDIAVIATPGHTGDSTSYRISDVLFSGDHVIGGSTVLVQDMTEYMESLDRLMGIGLRIMYPGHGPIIEDPDGVLAAYLSHRTQREAQILSAVEVGAMTVGEVVEMVYTDVPRALHRAAAISVGAHLRKLADEEKLLFPDRAGGWGAPVASA